MYRAACLCNMVCLLYKGMISKVHVHFARLGLQQMPHRLDVPDNKVHYARRRLAYTRL
jgi:hypothetical protein